MNLAVTIDKTSTKRLGRPLAKGGAKGGATGLRGKCWWLMRELGTFTINRLLETYATGMEKDAHNNLDNYLFRLAACGVVERLEQRQQNEVLTSNGCVVWRLTRNLGLLAPVWRREQKVLWDPNRQEVLAVIGRAPKASKASKSRQTQPQAYSEIHCHD